MAGNTADVEAKPPVPGTGQSAAGSCGRAIEPAADAAHKPASKAGPDGQGSNGQAKPASGEPAAARRAPANDADRADGDVASESDADLLAERVLLLSPTGRDAAILKDQLVRRGFVVEICPDIAALCGAIDEGAGAAFVAEEGLIGDALGCLSETLRRQPTWSDLPVVVMTEAGETTAYSRRLQAIVHAAGNVTLLPRPIRLVTLFSVIESALRSRRRQYEVRNLLEQTREAVDQRDRFLAMLGHELRNPLAAIVNSVGILRRFGTGDGELTHEQCEVIARQSSHMARLVDDLLDVARITSGKIVLSTQPVDLREVAGRALQALKLAAGQPRHHISFDTPNRPVIINADLVRLEQVLTNLLTNAIKYTPENGRIWFTVESIGDPAAGGEAVVRVRDTGEGVPPEMLERIFEPFAQLAQSLARSRGGLGMGLTVVKSLVEMHGGRVSVQSPGRGQGTEFAVYLPLAEPAEAPRPERPGAAGAAGGRHQTHPCDVLLVEDNPDSRRTLARLLKLYGHRVETADDGPRGLEKALARRPEVVLLDIGLPGMDGFEVGRRIRDGLGDQVFLIALTGYGQPEDRERVRRAGFDLHLVKPVEPDTLNRLLSARVCGDGQSRRPKGE
jgi:two-component system, sensor histidine kinase